MECLFRKGDLTNEACDLLVVNAFQEQKKLGGAAAAVDRALHGYLDMLVKQDGFKGKRGEVLVARTDRAIPAKRVLVVGLGKKAEFNEETIREVSAVAFREADRVKAKSVVSVLHGAGNGGVDAKAAGKAMVVGARLAAYRFDRYKKHSKKPSVRTFAVVSHNGTHARQASVGGEIGEYMAEGEMYARDLVNTPPSDMTPWALMEEAKRIAKESKGKIRVKVMDQAALERMGAGAILGIARGSDSPPFMVHLKYAPAGAKKRVALVGKAVTFDSGGLSIKPAEGMFTMKMDMAGAASVLGAFRVMTKLAPKIAVDGIFAAVENMPSGKAIKPGDIVKSMNGKTIEVLHTDAEGRVVLADALCYAGKQKPDVIIDLATLTGACMVALGEEITGVMSNDPKLEQKILTAASEVGEKMWSLPLEKSYKRELKSDVADLKNMPGRYGGALTAGLFLEEFVAVCPWAHLDIAGPSFAERDINAYTKKGATGAGVRTLLEFLRAM